MKYHPLRDGMIDSERINTVNDRAECLFVRLLLRADDTGRFYAKPESVKAACWPLKSYRIADVERALDDLEAARLIQRYTAKDGSRYLTLSNYQSGLKNPKSKFPAPADVAPQSEFQLVNFDHINQPTPSERKGEERKGKENEDTPLPPNWSEALKQAWADWTQHRKELKKPITPLARRQQIASIAGWSEERAITNIRHAISSGWTGIYDRQQHNGQRGRNTPVVIEERFSRAF